MVSAPSDFIEASVVFQQFIGAYLPSLFYRLLLSIVDYFTATLGLSYAVISVKGKNFIRQRSIKS